MSTETQESSYPKQPPPEPETPGEDKDCGCEPCDLEEFDGLACRAARYAKQAEIMTQVAADLEKYKKQYSEARVAFADAWDAVAAERTEIQKTLKEVEELLKCRLTPEEKECLDTSAEDVFEDLDACGPKPGCCLGECTFDDEVGADDDAAALTARIEEYRRDTLANTACFTSLVGEPAAIKAAIDALKTKVAELHKAATGDKTKVPRWYAQWLIYSRDLQPTHVGHGFTSVTAYSSCLCSTLQCIAQGWAAIARLEGAKAELDCVEKSRKAECERKAGAVLESILEAYECCVENQGEPAPEEPAPEEPEYPAPEKPEYPAPEKPEYPAPEKPEYPAEQAG